MKKYSLLILLLLIESSVLAKGHTLEDLLELMQKNNLQLKIEETKNAEAQAKINNWKSLNLPKFKATLGGERREVPSVSSLNENNLVGEFRGDYKLYTFGKISNQIKALESIKNEQKKLSDFKLVSLKKELEEEYYHALFYKEQLKLLKEEVAFNKTLKKQVKLRRKQGLVGNADILEIDMRDATLENYILQNEEHYQHTLDTLRKLLFVEHDFEIEVSGTIPHDHYHIVFNELIKDTLNNNVKLTTAMRQVEANNYLARSNSAERYPEINLKGRFGKMRIDEKYSDDNLEGIVGLYIDIPIFDGQKESKYKVQEAIAQRKQLRLKEVKNNTQIDLIHSYEKMLNIHKQVDLAEQNVKNAINYFKNVSSEYNRGVKNSIDLVSARDRLVNFKQDLLSSKRDYILTRIKLEKISGVTIN